MSYDINKMSIIVIVLRLQSLYALQKPNNIFTGERLQWLRFNFTHV